MPPFRTKSFLLKFLLMKTIQLAGGFVILRDGGFECFAGLLALKAS